MVTTFATFETADPKLALWLLSNPQPYAIANPDKTLTVRLTGISKATVVLPWPMITGADIRTKEGVPAVDHTQRYRVRDTQPKLPKPATPKRLPPPAPKGHA